MSAFCAQHRFLLDFYISFFSCHVDYEQMLLFFFYLFLLLLLSRLNTMRTTSCAKIGRIVTKSSSVFLWSLEDKGYTKLLYTRSADEVQQTISFMFYLLRGVPVLWLSRNASRFAPSLWKPESSRCCLKKKKEKAGLMETLFLQKRKDTRCALLFPTCDVMQMDVFFPWNVCWNGFSVCRLEKTRHWVNIQRHVGTDREPAHVVRCRSVSRCHTV